MVIRTGRPCTRSFIIIEMTASSGQSSATARQLIYLPYRRVGEVVAVSPKNAVSPTNDDDMSVIPTQKDDDDSSAGGIVVAVCLFPFQFIYLSFTRLFIALSTYPLDHLPPPAAVILVFVVLVVFQFSKKAPR